MTRKSVKIIIAVIAFVTEILRVIKKNECEKKQ